MDEQQAFFELKQKKEEELFTIYAASAGINKYKFTGLKESYDVKMRSGQTLFIVETKVRDNYDLAFFEKNGPFLEYKKINGMQKEKEKLAEKGIEVVMLYINFAKNGIQLFYINDVNPYIDSYDFFWKLLPKDNYNPAIKIQKLVAILNKPTEIIKY